MFLLYYQDSRGKDGRRRADALADKYAPKYGILRHRESRFFKPTDKPAWANNDERRGQGVEGVLLSEGCPNQAVLEAYYKAIECPVIVVRDPTDVQEDSQDGEPPGEKVPDPGRGPKVAPAEVKPPEDEEPEADSPPAPPKTSPKAKAAKK